ncbi:hypothetical protein LINGRAHAP2_LOCUS15037 [Linum grandiflorum]
MLIQPAQSACNQRKH